MVSFLIFGLFIGVFQWMVIRSQVDRAERWVLASILALALSAIPVMTDSADFVVLFFGGALLLGVVFSFLSTVLTAKQQARSVLLRPNNPCSRPARLAVF